MMDKFEKLDKCQKFFDALVDGLKETYYELPSCNKDASRYLIPMDAVTAVSYYGKPLLSFRVSDHWNWYANVKKCSEYTYVQCESMDMPKARHRLVSGGASKPRFGSQVCLFGGDGFYHAVYGEIFNRKTCSWEWLEGDVDDVIKMVTA